jgi:hypothetical protein
MDGFYYEIGRAVVGVAIIAAFVWFCVQLNKSYLGRVALFLLATVAYSAALFAIAWAAYALFLVSDKRPFSHAHDFLSILLSLGHALFLAAFFVLIASMWLSFWDAYARMTEKVLGIKLPRVNIRY